MGATTANDAEPIEGSDDRDGVIIHEWLEKRGGAERVVGALVDAFPGARLACLWSELESFHQRNVEQSWISRIPGRPRKALIAPFMPLIWRSFPKADVEWMVVSSHAFAHHTPAHGARKFVYVHTPARYIWAPEHDQRGASPFAAPVAAAMKRVDRRAAAASSATLVANSAFVAQRIALAWGRESSVVYPPVDIDHLRSVEEWSGELVGDDLRIYAGLPESFVVGASRLVTYKALDRVIETGELLNLPVVIAGDGPDRERLLTRASRATIPVAFLGAVSDELLYATIQRASLFVFPPIEDFGIVPVEAMALGTPVLVNRIGGAAESLAVTSYGAEADFGDLQSVHSAAERALSLDRRRGPSNIGVFARATFVSKMRHLVLPRGAE